MHRVRAIGAAVAMALAFALPGCVTTTNEPTVDVSKQAEATRNVGVDHFSNGRTAMAIRELTHARDLNPEDPVTLLWLGEAYRRKGRLEEAETHLLRALEMDPESQETLLNLSGLYIQMERYEQAIEQAQTLIDDPTFPEPWRALANRGWAELKLDRLGAARASFEEAIDYRPSYWQAHLDLGILDTMMGHRREAIDRFQRVLEMQPGYSAQAEAYYRLGEIYVSLGQREQAMEHFEIALERSPRGKWGKQSQKYLDLLR
jgi:protein O-GlcNAc transferase